MNTQTRFPMVISLVVGIALAGGLLATGGAQADWSGHHGALIKIAKVPAAYDAFWKLKNPGGPVELNPQPLPPRYLFQTHVSPGDLVGFNPQPDPPGYQ